jgi:hypothetical protein
MIEPLEIPARARHRIVEELRRRADVHPDRLGFFAIGEVDGHRNQISRPSREGAPRPAW